VNSGGFSGTGNGGAATLPVPKAVDAASSGDTAVGGSSGAAAEDAAAGAGSGSVVAGTTGVGGPDMLTGTEAGAAATRRAVDFTAERRAVTVVPAAFRGVFLVTVARFGLAFWTVAFVVRRVVDFVAGFRAFVARATGRFAAATLSVVFLVMFRCLLVRFAVVALLGVLLARTTRLSGRLAFVARTSFFALAADRAPADFDFAGFVGRLVARSDDFDAVLFLETARAIGLSPSERPPAIPTTTTIMTVLR
jgi:hypothetical protein